MNRRCERKKKAAFGRCRINVSLYFAVLVACLLITDTTGLVVYALLCAAIHEAGHLAALGRLGVPLRQISFEIFGIDIQLKSSAMLSYRQEIVISLAGAAANLFTALLCFAAEGLGFHCARLNDMLLFSLLLGGFNLLPACPLDGGRALEAVLCRRFGPQTAEKAMSAVSAALIVPLGAAGFYLVLRTGFNFTLAAAAVYLAAALVSGRGFAVPRSRAAGRPGS